MAFGIWFLLSAIITVSVKASDPFLATWMGQLSIALDDRSILDLSLPGTHDTLTYDLSTIIADGGIDGYDKLSIFLNKVTNLDDNLDALEFARTQAQTQVMLLIISWHRWRTWRSVGSASGRSAAWSGTTAARRSACPCLCPAR